MSSTSIFAMHWYKSAMEQLKRVRPDLSEETLEKYLHKKLEKMKDPPCILDNNYRKKTVRTTLSSIYDWVDTNKPICGGYGVFYKNQNESVNNVARCIVKFLESRSAMKAEMKRHPPDSYAYRHGDMLQAAEKICANAIYGAGGAPVSFFYNEYTAPSTTATAQSLISTTYAAFEMFMENGIRFYDTSEAIAFINNIASEKTKLSMDGIRPRTREEVEERIVQTHLKPKKANRVMIRTVLNGLDDETITRIYYKNNLYEFTASCATIITTLKEIMDTTESFRAPVKKLMTPELEVNLGHMWDYYSEFVHYKHPVYNRIYRLKTSKRRSVLVIDTDSNMVSIYNWINMVMDCFIDERNTRDHEENVYTAASVICVFLTNMITDTLAQYCENAHVLKSQWKNINMKNEFFFLWLLTTDVKKNYLSSILLREGQAMGGKMDIKGLSFVKSIMSEYVSSYLKNIVKEDILGAKIQYANIIKKLNALSHNIRESVAKGEYLYGKPMAVKAPGHYANPLSEMGVRAVMGWNTAYPDNPIELPENVMVLKVRMEREKDIEDLKDIEPEIYQRLVTEIYRSSNKDIAKGLNAFAVPMNIERVPEWLIPYINVDTIIQDNTNSFFPVLKSLSFEIINTKSDRQTYSNILNVG